MGCITSTESKSPPEVCTPQQIQINRNSKEIGKTKIIVYDLVDQEKVSKIRSFLDNRLRESSRVVIAASKTPSFASSISCEKQLSQTTSNCASPSVVDGLTSVAMARSVSETAEFAQEEVEEQTSQPQKQAV